MKRNVGLLLVNKRCPELLNIVFSRSKRCVSKMGKENTFTRRTEVTQNMTTLSPVITQVQINFLK